MTFVENPTNLGVAAGYNVGIRTALGEGADYVLLLNNDLVVEPDIIQRLLVGFQWPDTAVVSPVITYYDDPDTVWFAGGSYNPLFGYTRHKFLGTQVSRHVSHKKSAFTTDYVPTCATLTSRHAFDSIGLLDERFVVTHDDVDWCLRAQDKGFRVRVVPEPLVRHKVSVSAGVSGSTTLGVKQAYNYAKYGLILTFKRSTLVTIVPQLFGQLFIRFPYLSLQMLAAGRWKGIPSYLSGLVAGLRETASNRDRD